MPDAYGAETAYEQDVAYGADTAYDQDSAYPAYAARDVSRMSHSFRPLEGRS
ncbi:hypothetical protein ACFV94_21710 [Streptomyces sp. NPDC059896]|uniref:hypothetical protein n=1 Tax=Streptomyces sp. NPDC059896 TaxID=3346993 RepID=UPI00364615F2